MAKASLSYAKAKVGSFAAGLYRLTNPRFVNDQYQSDPMTTQFAADGLPLDATGNRLDGDPVELKFGFGREAHKNGITPGRGKSADDPDPTNLGKEKDIEGNTIYLESPETQLNGSCAAMVFFKSLEKIGVPQSIIDGCFAPSFDGLEVVLEQLDSVGVNEKLGTRLNVRPQAGGDGGLPKYKIATRWHNSNTWKGGSSTATNAASTATTATNAPAAGAAAGTATAATATTAAPTGSADAVSIAIECVKKVAGEKKGQNIAFGRIVSHLVNTFGQGKYKVKLPEVKTFFNNVDWLTEQLIDHGASLNANDAGVTESVTFEA